MVGQIPGGCGGRGEQTGYGPRLWVVQHAQIARGLSADWQKEIAEATDHEERPKWRYWTAGHLVVIARLPVSLQAAYLEKVRKDYRFDHWPAATVKAIEDAVKLESALSVQGAVRRGFVPRVRRAYRSPGTAVGRDGGGLHGDKARCLNKKCWDKKTARANKDLFVEAAGQVAAKYEARSGKTLPASAVLPVSLAVKPDDWGKQEEYRKQMSALRRTFPKLLTADRVEVVVEGTKGAVAAIVVAGRGKGTL